MKKFFPIFVGLTAVTATYAQGLNIQDRMMLNRDKLMKSGLIKPTPMQGTPQLPSTRGGEETPEGLFGDYVNAFVRIAEGYSASDLEAAGMKVSSLRKDLAIVSFPKDSAESFASLPCVRKLSIEKQLKPQMDKARSAAKVDDIHQGTSLSLPYTGKGVNAAIVDQGVDPNHISFFDQEGKNRVKYLTYMTYNSNYNLVTNYFGEDIYDLDDKGNPVYYPTIDKFTTDDYAAYHGTHTLNILGGSYKGDVTYYKDGKKVTEPNPYYGAAPDANLSVSCGDLRDAAVAYGINGLLDYAAFKKEETGMPTVLSLSLGSTAGPHDPDNLMNYFLSLCGEEAIVVLSAGNEGDLKIALNKTFTSPDTTFITCVYPYGYRYDPSAGPAGSYVQSIGTYNTYIRNGIVMVYANDEKPFTIRGFVATGSEGNYHIRSRFSLAEGEGNYYCSSNDYVNSLGTGRVNNTISRYFNGFIGGGCMLDEDLGRYYGAFDYYLETNPNTGFTADGGEGVIVGFEIIGSDGQRIDCYGDGANTWLYNYGMPDWIDGSRDGSISDMAVGENVLVVGAYNTRHDWTALDGKTYSYDDYEGAEGFKLGEIGPYSSFGTLADGRTLPHVCAPGTAIMSAYSSPYVDYYFEGHEDYIPSNTTAKATVNGKDYYWKPETGTSMSAPFVAGSIALWLEAKPDLTIQDVYDIIEKTSVKDSQVAAGNPVQWGAGKFDALAGLKAAINDTGIEGITVDDRNDRLILTEVTPGIFNVFVGATRGLDINVYSMAGSNVYSEKVAGNETTIDLNSLSKGIYVLKANTHAQKIYIK